MLGSYLFWYHTERDDSLRWIVRLVQIGVSASASCLMAAVLSQRESIRFLAFCAFELALGMYFPAIGILKSQIVHENRRGWTYALMRMPLNVFVMSILCTTGEG